MDSLFGYNFRIGPVGAGPSAYPKRVAEHVVAAPLYRGGAPTRLIRSSHPTQRDRNRSWSSRASILLAIRPATLPRGGAARAMSPRAAPPPEPKLAARGRPPATAISGERQRSSSSANEHPMTLHRWQRHVLPTQQPASPARPHATPKTAPSSHQTSLYPLNLLDFPSPDRYIYKIDEREVTRQVYIEIS